jgi:hypothetical protein
MTKYLLLYRSPVSAQEQMATASAEQAQAGMDAWMSWAGQAGSAIVDLGSPVALADTLGAGGSGGSSVGGYSIMEADSIEALRDLLAGHPHLMLNGASIEVHEHLSMPGM